MRSPLRCAALVAFAVALAASGARAQPERESAAFPSLDGAFKGQLTATLYRPAGDGPFPAMVLLHTCSGVHGHEDDWARWFAGNGYEALVVDSFGPRGVESVCGGGTPTMRTRAYDAYGALAYLQSRRDVVASRIGVIGWSHGGGTALVVDDARFVDGPMHGTRFRAAIALYPACGPMSPAGVAAPLLVLLGSADDWTPAPPCARGAGALAAKGFPVEVHTYDGATHAFDNPADRGEVHVRQRTYTLRYDAPAAEDAHRRVLAFLDANLK